MGFLDRVRGAFAPWDGTHGRPPSGNGASSFHLGWAAPAGEWIVAEVTLEVLEPPPVPKLYFWAMQVSFTDRGRHGGAGHIGLQWHQDFPGKTAVNWGGYAAEGGELRGSASSLRSTVGNVNTRDYAWQPGQAYRLRVARGEQPGPNGLQSWRGEVVELSTGTTVHVRDLWAAGTTLSDPIVWSEVFADCDEPSTTVRWSDFRLTDETGATAAAEQLSVNYQALGDGGCAATCSSVDERGWLQVTNTPRRTPQGALLARPD